MKAEQKIKKEILALADVEIEDSGDLEAIWNEVQLTFPNFQDEIEAFRESGVEIDLPQQPSIHFSWLREYKLLTVARQMSDGSWVGWNYLYGGGKHGDPFSYSWIENSFNLNVVKEETVTTVKREFELKYES